jgi:hypothetical protein
MLVPERHVRYRSSGAFLAGAVALCLVATGCVFRSHPTTALSGAPTLAAMARRLGGDVVERMVRGLYPGRSGEISMVAEPSNVIVRWSAGALGTPEVDRSTTHATPWSYHQRVPLILYGPGFVRGGARLDEVVDVSDLAPTFAELMGFRFNAPDGRSLDRALLPPGNRNGRPRLIVLVAYDGGGWNLLQRWPDAWPVLRHLASSGSTYTNATIGSSPSVTAAIHATMGTGAYPRVHGVPEHAVRRPDGTIGDVYSGDEADTSMLEAETLADAWDFAHGNRPWTGIVATEPWHLGMLGTGALVESRDRDVAVLWHRDDERFYTNENLYVVPDYLPGGDVLDGRLRALDSTDGAIDGTWMGNDLQSPRVVLGSPAFVEHQRDALLEIVRREPIGRDALTDLLFVEFKSTDLGAHIWNLVGEEEQHVLRAQDEAIGALVRLLDQVAGRDRYVLAVTADHGLTPLPEAVDGLRIHPDVVGARVNEYFGRELVESVTPSSMFLDVDALTASGITATEVARYVASLRYRDVLPEDADVDSIQEGQLQRAVFAGVFPSSFLQTLKESDIRALGPGRFPEGDLQSADHPYAGIIEPASR